MSQRTRRSTRATSHNVLKFDTVASPSPSPSDTDHPPRKKLKPLNSLSNPPRFRVDVPTQSSNASSQKGKAKAEDVLPDGRLWIDIYEPQAEADLAIHKRKVEDVRRWLGEALEGGPSKNPKFKKYRRILALTGPAGSGKTATVRLLAQEFGVEILEWRNAVGEDFTQYGVSYESIMDKFKEFLRRASTCQNIFNSSTPNAASSQLMSQNPTTSQSSKVDSKTISRGHIILLEDLPNILHAPTQESFHAALSSFVLSESIHPIPIVMILSDAGVQGESGNDNEFGGFGGFWKRNKDAIDIRTALPKSLFGGPYVTHMEFNPIAPTLMRKALQNLLASHFSPSSPSSSSQKKSSNSGHPISKEVLEDIIESSGGDIRNAIMSLQFACSITKDINSSNKDHSKNKRKTDGKSILKAISHREHHLQLFHLLGKLLYNKRKNDPPASVMVARSTRQLDKERKVNLPDPPKIPSWLSDHYRRTSLVDIEALYAATPIDSSLMALYIHQNYTQYCPGIDGEDGLDECLGVADNLSWADSNGSDSWIQANPHRFHILALGTLHSLPSPVPRRGQALSKPEFFDYLQKQRLAADSLNDTSDWLSSPNDRERPGARSIQGETELLPCNRWRPVEVALDVGPMLRLRSMGARTGLSSWSIPPSTWVHFGQFKFDGSMDGSVKPRPLGETDLEDVDELQEDISMLARNKQLDTAEDDGLAPGWLAEDDIEDF